MEAQGGCLDEAILEELASQGPASIAQLLGRVGCSRPTLARRLDELRRRGLVELSRRGRSKIYKLTEKGMIAADAWACFTPRRERAAEELAAEAARRLEEMGMVVLRGQKPPGSQYPARLAARWQRSVAYLYIATCAAEVLAAACMGWMPREASDYALIVAVPLRARGHDPPCGVRGWRIVPYEPSSPLDAAEEVVRAVAEAVLAPAPSRPATIQVLEPTTR